MAWHGKQHKGAKRARKARKHVEAQARNERTPHLRTRAHREKRCGVSDPRTCSLASPL